jgi:GDP-L-fucose synthase
VGSAIVGRLQQLGYQNLVTPSRAELDLCDPAATDAFFAREQPDYVFLAAARVGGILANDTYPVDFLMDNLAIQANVIRSAHRHGVTKLEFLGSSCIYPKFAPNPISEEALLTGPLEPTNQWYAIAKIAGIKMIEAYRRQYGFSGISLMPTNLYGPYDNFDLDSAHVVPALLRKFHEAQESGAPHVVVWGTGTPLRELLYIEDLADAAVFLMQSYDQAGFINVGSGEEISIADLARLVARVVGYSGGIVFDPSRPDGTPRKLIDFSRLRARMYHRFHAPHDCRVDRVTYVSGDTWNVNPIALRRIERLFCKNERAILKTTLTGAHAVTLVPVAAVLVASIRLHFLDAALNINYRGAGVTACAAEFRKGEEMGYFEHGSTIIVFAPRGFSLCDELRDGAALRMGQPLMRLP